MKKLLLGATALTIVGFAGAASAENVTTSPFNLDVGGFATLGVGYVDSAASGFSNPSDTGADGQPVHIQNNAEFHLNFSLVADNGLTFGYKMEMEVNGSANDADEYVGFVKGSFGTLEVGVEDGAADRLTGFWATYVFTNAGDGTGMLFDTASTGVAAPDTDGADTGDGFKVTYFTPKFAGFEAAVTYAASSNESATGSPVTSDTGSGVEVGARYSNTFGDFSLSVGGGYTFFLSDDTDATTTINGVTNSVRPEAGYTVGAVVGFSGFELSAIYGVDQVDIGDDRSSFGVGASYSTGPWLFGLSYGQNVENPVAEFDDAYGIAGEVVYTLAPGVRTGIALEYASDSIETQTVSTTSTNLESDSAFAAGVFLGLTF